jgi:hypothetical protein
MSNKAKAELSLEYGEHILITCTGVRGKVRVSGRWYVTVTSKGTPVLLKEVARSKK